MSETLINQITLDFLLNKKMYNNQIKNKKSKQVNHEERKFYRKRICNLFKELITDKPPDDLLLDVKYTYENFINATINYFKAIDSNDIIQAQHYEDVADEPCETNETCENNETKVISNFSISNIDAADAILMRTVKIETPTLDKYVKRTSFKKKEEKLVLPKQKEINLNDPQLKNKGIKNNINNIYEDTNEKKKNEEK
jgi:hypothetical protein